MKGIFSRALIKSSTDASYKGVKFSVSDDNGLKLLRLTFADNVSEFLKKRLRSPNYIWTVRENDYSFWCSSENSLNELVNNIKKTIDEFSDNLSPWKLLYSICPRKWDSMSRDYSKWFDALKTVSIVDYKNRNVSCVTGVKQSNSVGFSHERRRWFRVVSKSRICYSIFIKDEDSSNELWFSISKIELDTLNESELYSSDIYSNDNLMFEDFNTKIQSIVK